MLFRSIGDALLELLDNRDLAQRLIELGRAREATFTWEATARKTLDSYERAWKAK